ncbi:MAG TPA: serpin family protein, partial [Gemmatimonadaceae bacterium]
MTSVRSYTRLPRQALLVVAFATALSTVACSAATEPRTTPGQLTSLPRDLTPAEQKLIGASNAFSFALWNKVSVAQRDSNVFISPLSASFALGMILNGAANETFDQMRTALQVEGVSQADIDAGYKSLVALLTSLDPGVTMQIANSVWYRQGFSVNQSFIDAVSTYFDANAQALDFSDPASLTTINSWVSRKTNGKIATILDRIAPQDVMFLINALYFKGSWRQQFDPAQTTDGTFTTTSGAGQPVRLMHRRDRMLYAES